MVRVACLVQRVSALAGSAGYKAGWSVLAGEKDSPQLNLLKRETARNSHGKAPNVAERNMSGEIITANDYG
jgi:hypothetical protein